MSAEEDRQREIAYKSHIVNEVAKALRPWVYDNSEKFSEGARKILQANAKEEAKKVMRAIAPWIKPWDVSGFKFEEKKDG